MSNFHVPLPEPLHEDLRRASSALGRPATEIVREALVRWLEEHRRNLRRDEVRAWALQNAGTAYDLDPGLEAEAAEHLLAAEPEHDK